MRFLATLFAWVRLHIFLSVAIALVVSGGAFFAVQRLSGAGGEIRYVLGTVSVSDITASVSVSGQVSANDQLDIKPKVSGDIVSVSVAAGDAVKAGSVLMRLDPETAQKAVRDARTNLETAQIALEKLKKPAGELTLLQAQNAVVNAEDALQKQYEDSLTHVGNAFLDLPEVTEGLKDIVLGTDTNSTGQWNIDYYQNAANYDNRALIYRNDAYNAYVKAEALYDAALDDYQTIGVTADRATTEKILTDSYSLTIAVLDAVKKTNTLLQFYSDVLTVRNQTVSSVATADLTDLNTYLGTLNTHLSTLLTDTNTLKADKQTVEEKRTALQDVNDGSDALDIQSAQLAVTKAENALMDAQNNLADYTVRAPFDATVASVGVRRYDTVSTASVLVTLVTSQKFAELPLNEIDVSKIDVGDKAALAFDAVEGLELPGTVAEIDSVAAVDQGVVSYAVKVAFDAQDPRVKSGMTVDADIITDSKSGVLVVPVSAVKTLNNQNFVLVFESPLEGPSRDPRGVVSPVEPTRIPVTTGITDDMSVEILSGLSEGQQIVVRTTNGTPTASQAPSIFGGAPGGGSRGGTVRFQR